MTQVEVSRSSFCLRIVVCPVALLHAQSICPTKVERSFSSKPTSALWSSPSSPSGAEDAGQILGLAAALAWSCRADGEFFG